MVGIVDAAGRVWSTRNDLARIEQSLRHQEIELGFPPTLGRNYTLDPELCRQLGIPSTLLQWDENLSTGAFRHLERVREMAAREGREVRFDELPFVPRARDDLRTILSEANIEDVRNWEQLLRELKHQGYRLEPRARGLVVTDGTEFVADSHISRYASQPRLEARLGRFETYLEQRTIGGENDLTGSERLGRRGSVPGRF